MSIEPKSKLVVIGKIGAPHGLKGWLKITSFTERKEDIFRYQPWLIEKSTNHWSSHMVTQHSMNNDSACAHLEGIDDRTHASLLTNKDIAITAEQLPTLNQDEYYWRDLEGLEVSTVEGHSLGHIDHLFSTGANDVIVVEGEKRHLIPFLFDDVVTNINLDEKKMTVDWDPEF